MFVYERTERIRDKSTSKKIQTKFGLEKGQHLLRQPLRETVKMESVSAWRRVNVRGLVEQFLTYYALDVHHLCLRALRAFSLQCKKRTRRTRKRPRRYMKFTVQTARFAIGSSCDRDTKYLGKDLLLWFEFRSSCITLRERETMKRTGKAGCENVRP